MVLEISPPCRRILKFCMRQNYEDYKPNKPTCVGVAAMTSLKYRCLTFSLGPVTGVKWSQEIYYSSVQLGIKDLRFSIATFCSDRHSSGS